MLQLLIIMLASLAFLVVLLVPRLKQNRATQLDREELQCQEKTAPNYLSSIKDSIAIAEKLDFILKTEKIYTKSDLCIADIASELGTNRSYTSRIINTFYNQNFCSFINQYRFHALEEIITHSNGYTYKELASMCGFGSIDTMKRIVKLNTGLSLRDWIVYLTYLEPIVLSDS